MATVKVKHARKSPTMTHQAPSRLLALSGGRRWRLGGGGVDVEQELLKCFEDICQEYGRNLACEMTITGYQAVPPEAVSMPEPPERAWLVWMDIVRQGPGKATEQAEVIAVLRDDEIRLILR
jgi:hypothetical protein